MIEAAEYVLKDFGFYDVRVRHHEFRMTNDEANPRIPSNVGQGMIPHSSFVIRHLARIEVGPSELPKLLENGLSLRVAEALKKIGYAHVTVDLQGYRRGSLNELKAVTPASKV